ncbi:hypothetical protein BDV11DRAFT_192388 [Aspergillus similis]
MPHAHLSPRASPRLAPTGSGGWFGVLHGTVFIYGAPAIPEYSGRELSYCVALHEPVNVYACHSTVSTFWGL